MEFDRIEIEITQLEDGRWSMIATGVLEAEEGGVDESKSLGSIVSKDRSTLIDWFIEKVEEA